MTLRRVQTDEDGNILTVRVPIDAPPRGYLERLSEVAMSLSHPSLGSIRGLVTKIVAEPGFVTIHALVLDSMTPEMVKAEILSAMSARSGGKAST